MTITSLLGGSLVYLICLVLSYDTNIKVDIGTSAFTIYKKWLPQMMLDIYKNGEHLVRLQN